MVPWAPKLAAISAGRSRSRSKIVVLAPEAASRFAIASPIPFAPPVTTASLPAKLICMRGWSQRLSNDWRSHADLKHVRWRLDTLQPQVHFQLSAVVRRMREVGPQPLEACHLAILRPGHRVQFLERDGRYCLVAEIE